MIRPELPADRLWDLSIDAYVAAFRHRPSRWAPVLILVEPYTICLTRRLDRLSSRLDGCATRAVLTPGSPRDRGR